MGMFDEVLCEYPLPQGVPMDATYQSKDTPAQNLDTYRIRPDFDLSAESAVGFWSRRDYLGWARVPYFGSLEIYHYQEDPGQPGGTSYSVLFWLRDGVVNDLIALVKGGVR
jgi:hypothetical protein